MVKRVRRNSSKIGDKSGKLIVIELLGKLPNKSGIYLKCLCNCGEILTIRADSFRNGKFNNCNKCGVWSSFNKLGYIYSSYKDSSKDRKILFSLTKDQVNDIVFKNCYYCNSLPRERTIKRGKKNRNIAYNGIDRVNPSLGYVSNNIVPCCYSCNIAKSDMSFTDFLYHIKSIYENLKLDKFHKKITILNY